MPRSYLRKFITVIGSSHSLCHKEGIWVTHPIIHGSIFASTFWNTFLKVVPLEHVYVILLDIARFFFIDAVLFCIPAMSKNAHFPKTTDVDEESFSLGSFSLRTRQETGNALCSSATGK